MVIFLSFIILYHLPIAGGVFLVLTVGGVPEGREEVDGLVLGQGSAEAVDVVAQIVDERIALIIERSLRIVGDRLADGDDRVFLLQIYGIEFERLFALAIVQTGDIDKARLQLVDVLRVPLGRFGEDHQMVAVGQRADALLERLDDPRVVIDGDGVRVAQKGRQSLGDDTRHKAPEPFAFAGVGEEYIMVGVVDRLLAVQRTADRPRPVLGLEVERHHDGAADRGMVADEYRGLIGLFLIDRFRGRKEHDARKAADDLVIDVVEFHIGVSF